MMHSTVQHTNTMCAVQCSIGLQNASEAVAQPGHVTHLSGAVVHESDGRLALVPGQREAHVALGARVASQPGVDGHLEVVVVAREVVLQSRHSPLVTKQEHFRVEDAQSPSDHCNCRKNKFQTANMFEYFLLGTRVVVLLLGARAQH